LLGGIRWRFRCHCVLPANRRPAFASHKVQSARPFTRHRCTFFAPPPSPPFAGIPCPRLPFCLHYPSWPDVEQVSPPSQSACKAPASALPASTRCPFPPASLPPAPSCPLPSPPPLPPLPDHPSACRHSFLHPYLTRPPSCLCGCQHFLLCASPRWTTLPLQLP
jgi:hypothetical protein